MSELATDVLERPPTGNHDGENKSLDGTSTEPFTEDDIAQVLYHGANYPGDWDGDEAAILLLKDGRYVAYECWWGPTGDSFSEDAYYGGDGVAYFAKDLRTAILGGLGDEGRRLAKVPQELWA